MSFVCRHEQHDVKVGLWNTEHFKFKEGKITLEFYRGTIQAYSVQEEEIIQAQSLFNQERLALEELVGVELKDVEGYMEFTSRLTRETQLRQ